MTQTKEDETMKIAEYTSSKVQGEGIRIEFDGLTFPGMFAVLHTAPRTDGYTGTNVFMVGTFDSEPEAREAANSEWIRRGY